MSRKKKTVEDLMKMPKEELRKLAAKQLKWGRKMLAKERAKRGMRAVQ